MISRLFCHFYQPKIGAYETDTLSITERERFARHLSVCSHCQQALTDYRTMGEQLRTLARHETPITLSPDLWKKIDAQIQATPQLPQNSFVATRDVGSRANAHRLRPVLATASVLCLGVFAFANRAQFTSYLAPATAPNISASPNIVAVADTASSSPAPLPSPQIVAQSESAEMKSAKAVISDAILPSPDPQLTAMNTSPLPPVLLKTPAKAVEKAIVETKKPFTEKDFEKISQEIMKKGNYDPFLPVEQRGNGSSNASTQKIKNKGSKVGLPLVKPKAFPTTTPTASPAPINIEDGLPLVAPKGDPTKVAITMDGVKMRHEASKAKELSEIEINGLQVLNRQNDAVRQSNMFSRGRSSVRVIPVSMPTSPAISSTISGAVAGSTENEKSEKAKDDGKAKVDEKSVEKAVETPKKVLEKISETGK
jgi:hypothetical protein